LVEHHTNTSISSGGGWHVDKRSKQFKAILYLNTVDDSTGYFCIIPQTSKKLDEFKTVPKFHGDTSMTRFETGELIEKGIFETRVKILGNPGDLILVDTSNIHRGEEIQKGKRYSLTNYYYN
jgi:predicted 2-oxoglutarate/Fe(II)-dependent dioxygenase YbiX